MKGIVAIVGLSTLCLAAPAASAQDEDEDMADPCEGGEVMEGDAEAAPEDGEASGDTAESAPTAEGDGAAAGDAPPMITPKGKIAVDVALGVNLSSDAVAKPLSILPDVFYGVADKLEVGLAHSSYAIEGFWGEGLGGGLCLSGEDNGCAKAYDGPIGILARFGLMAGDIDLAADGGVVIRHLSDPMMAGIKLGVRGRKMMDKLAIGFAPNIYVGLTERDGGNKEYLSLPVGVNYMVDAKLAAGVQTGIHGPLDGFGDSFVIPISLGAMYALNESMSVGGSFTLHRVTGGTPEGAEGPGAADLRGLSLFVGWHN